MADERKGCVIRFADKVTGREEGWGCLRTKSWTMNQPTPEIEVVATFDEAVLRPFLDETFAVARAQRWTELHPRLAYKIIVPDAGKKG